MIKHISIIALMLLASLTAGAQKVTFASAGFEQGVRQHLGLSENDDVLQTQVDTITRLDLSGLEITDVHDVAWLPVVRELDLSNNSIKDITPLAELDSLESLNLKNNFLEDADRLAFTRAKKMTVNLTNNQIADFTAFLRPSPCQFTMIGMNRQQLESTEQFELYQLYANVDEKDKVKVTYRGQTNMPATVTLSAGESSQIAVLDGSTYSVAVEGKAGKAFKVIVSNGTHEDSTYVVPVTFHASKPQETIDITTGLPADYRIAYAHAQYGTVTAVNDVLRYTAPEEKTPDLVSFSYYQGAQLRGYGHVVAGLQFGDANADGKVSITDAEGVVNHILGKASTSFVRRAADVNRDNTISITDAVGVVNIILGNDAAGAR